VTAIVALVGYYGLHVSDETVNALNSLILVILPLAAVRPQVAPVTEGANA